MISSIQIKNFKSIRELDLALSPINVLIGSNGVGKSNFISFFKLLRSMKKNELNTYVAKQGYMDNLMYFGERKEDMIEGKIIFLNEYNTPTNGYEFELLAGNQQKAFIKTEYSLYNKGSKSLPNWSSSWDKINGETSKILTTSKIYRDKYLREYFDTFRVYHFHDTSSDAPLKKTARLHDNDVLREDGSNLAAFLYLLQERYPKHFKKIEHVIRSIAPFFEGFNLKPDNLNPEFIQLEWKEKNFDRYQNVNNLSDGTLRFIALTTLMLQPNPPKVIIIDEPELGLHPSAIGKLAGLIRKASAKSQIIISTQSVNLVNNFEPKDIITVDRVNGQSSFSHLEEEKLNVWLEDYNLGDLWEKHVIKGQP